MTSSNTTHPGDWAMARVYSCVKPLPLPRADLVDQVWSNDSTVCAVEQVLKGVIWMTKWCIFLPVRKQAFELSCTVLVLCILVQLSSRWYLCTLESLSAIRPVFQKFPQHCLWNSSRVPRPFKGDRQACFFWRLFPPTEWSCDIFGFVIAGSVSSCVKR